MEKIISNKTALLKKIGQLIPGLKTRQNRVVTDPVLQLAEEHAALAAGPQPKKNVEVKAVKKGKKKK